MTNWSPRKDYDCACCTPFRQIYFRSQGKLQVPYHEDDHTIARAAR